MCTAITYKTNDFYFGRTLDYDFSYAEEVTVTPRNYNFAFRDTEDIKNHPSIIGMAYVCEGFPLYYDATNEMGLSAAGLNFVGNAHYSRAADGYFNIAQFEFIPWLLCRCATVKEVRHLLKNINITDTPFSASLPAAQLHWLIADKTDAITVEAMRHGIKIHENRIGVLTNNPPFEYQMFALNNYMSLTAKGPKNLFAKGLPLEVYSRGMGAFGLPGDLSSQSRFIRAAFTKLNSVSGGGEAESVGQFFHILDTVNQTQGCCEISDGKYEKTIYTCCMNATRGVYYYTTYYNRQITAINMHQCDLNGSHLIRFPLVKEQQILWQKQH